MGMFLDIGSSGQGSLLFGRQIYVGGDMPRRSVALGCQYSMNYCDFQVPHIYGLGIDRRLYP